MEYYFALWVNFYDRNKIQLDPIEELYVSEYTSKLPHDCDVDILICPDCGSDDCFYYDHDEVQFDKGGLFDEHVIVNCRCQKCHTDFKIGFQFEYNITKHWVRK